MKLKSFPWKADRLPLHHTRNAQAVVYLRHSGVKTINGIDPQQLHLAGYRWHSCSERPGLHASSKTHSMSPMKTRHTAPVITAALLALLSGCASLASDASTPVAPPSTKVVLQTDQTVLGQPIVYPSGSPGEVTAAIVTLEPGARTGWHRHPVPLVAYILEGELTVAYQDHGERVYRAGDALVEAIETPHEGHNSGDAAARLLVVFIGAEGTPNTTPIK